MDFYSRVQDMAIEGQYEEVLEQLGNPANAESVGQCVLEVVRFLGNEYLSDEDRPLDLIGDTVDFCERAFAILARVTKPKEVLLAFLELVTCVRRDIRLRLMLPPIQTVLIRVLPVEKRCKELAWFIQTLDSILEQTPIPPNYGLEGEEQQFMQVENNVEQISNNLEELVEFYQPFVLDLSSTTNEDLKKARKILATSIIHVFEFMLTYVDLSQRLAELAKKLVGFLCHLENDLLKFVSYLSAKSLATLFYVVQANGVYRERLFCVYSNRYILELSLPMSRCLLDNSHEFSVQKGISLLESAVNLIGHMELEESALEMDEFASVTRSLVNVMVTNSVLSFRKQSVKLLVELINRFERSGRYTFYVRLLNGVKHSGVQELIICEFKKNLHQVLIDGNEREMNCFVGCGLERALRLMTRLPKGAETDLIDERERVLAALNLLIYLLKRDGPDVNVTGVWTMIESVEEKFVKPLQSAIDLSRAHFTAELDYQREVERGTACDRDQPEVSMSVQGLPLPQLPTKQKIETIQSMLTGIDLIQRRQRLLHSTSKTLNNESEFDNYSSEDEDTESMDSAVDDVKQSILKAALTHVHQHNWSRMALAKGADSVGLAAAAHGLFSRGEVELVEYFNQTCNQELVNSLEKIPPQTQRERSEEQMNVIRSTLEQRLRMILPYIDSWPKALTLMSHPPNVLYSAKNLFEMVDDVLYYAGDRSADFSWYPKRAGLAAVYVATELALLNDKSTDYADTWSFLDRRLQDYNCGGTIYKKTETAVENLPEFVGGTIATLRNMLGIGSISR